MTEQQEEWLEELHQLTIKETTEILTQDEVERYVDLYELLVHQEKVKIPFPVEI